MLALVVADGHLVGVVEEDVGGHERRVGEQAAGHEPAAALSALSDLSLNWVMRRSSPIEAVHSMSQASSLCSCTWLCTNSVDTVGSRPDGQEGGGQAEGLGPQLRRVLGHGEGVEVDHAVEGFGALVVDPVAQGAQVAAEGRVPGRFHAREHAGHPGRS